MGHDVMVPRLFERETKMTKETVKTDTAPTDDQIMTLAVEMRAELPGLTLGEAIAKAEAKLTIDPNEGATVFELRVTVKPRVAALLRKEFEGHPTMTVEERMSIWVATFMNRESIRARERGRPAQQIGQGKAVGISRAQFQAQTD